MVHCTYSLTGRYLSTTSPYEPLVQIQNNFTEIFFMMPSNKSSHTIQRQELQITLTCKGTSGQDYLPKIN